MRKNKTTLLVLVSVFLSLNSWANIEVAENLASNKDFLGLRIYLKKAAPKVRSIQDWFAYRNIISTYSNDLGFDLLVLWDKKFPALTNQLVGSSISRSWDKADQYMARGRYEEAFVFYQKIAQWLNARKERMEKGGTVQYAAYIRTIEGIYPYILQSMGRALYGARRYEESYEVYDWIPHNYVRFRQVLFEKMWAGFRANRFDQALGAIASQYSLFYNRNVSPEAFLVEVYLYKKLCRNKELRQVLKYIQKERIDYSKGQVSIEDWALSDPYRFALWNMVFTKDRYSTQYISSSERNQEKARLKTILKKQFDKEKEKRVEELDQIIAYSQLATMTAANRQLKGIEKLPDRSQIFKMGLEIWPSDSGEEWADEVGKHRYLGESLCKYR